jgi:hypothetical protein
LDKLGHSFRHGSDEMIATTPLPMVLRSNELTIRTAIYSLEISQLRAVFDEQH